MGEWAPYWNDKLRGDFLGLTARHDQAHLIRSVLEGVAFALRDALTQLEAPSIADEDNSVAAEDIRLIGQGSRSPLWSQIIADVLRRPVKVPEQTDAAYGAALIAAVGLGVLELNAERLGSMIRIRQRLEPDSPRAELYDELFDIYRDADTATRQIAERLHQFEHKHNA